MPGHALFKKLLVEKEKAINRKESVNAGLFLATTFMLTASGYSILSYLAAQPALSHNPEETGQRVVWPTTGNGSPVPIKGQPLNAGRARPDVNSKDWMSEPDSGVKLLMAIFSRLGSGPELASGQMESTPRWGVAPNVWGAKSKTRNRELASAQLPAQNQFSQGLINGSADPALSIRPQLSKKAVIEDGSAFNSLGSGQNAPPVQDSLNASNSKSKIVSESPYIREFAQNKSESADAKKPSWSAGKMQVNVVDEPMGRARAERINLIDHNRDVDRNLVANSNAENINGIIRPSEQPGLFKYVREYMKEPPRAAPAAAAPAPSSYALAPQSYAPAEDKLSGAKQLRAKDEPALTRGRESLSDAATLDTRSTASASYRQELSVRHKTKSLAQLAFLPPNAVHGINGLSLGASIGETTAFFKSHGKFSKVVISGFQILTLKNEKGQVVLQAFSRDNRLEALRVFSSSYMPQQLGINLGEDLPTMKASFGEPAFILEEPRSSNHTPLVVAKNYVYPISQVSFQLSRPNAGAAPQILSMFLFKFL